MTPWTRSRKNATGSVWNDGRVVYVLGLGRSACKVTARVESLSRNAHVPSRHRG